MKQKSNSILESLKKIYVKMTGKKVVKRKTETDVLSDIAESYEPVDTSNLQEKLITGEGIAIADNNIKADLTDYTNSHLQSPDNPNSNVVYDNISLYGKEITFKSQKNVKVAQQNFVKLIDAYPSATFDPNEEYYLYSNGEYRLTHAVTADNFEQSKSRLYIVDSVSEISFPRKTGTVALEGTKYEHNICFKNWEGNDTNGSVTVSSMISFKFTSTSDTPITTLSDLLAALKETFGNNTQTTICASGNLDFYNAGSRPFLNTPISQVLIDTSNEIIKIVYWSIELDYLSDMIYSFTYASPIFTDTVLPL